MGPADLDDSAHLLALRSIESRSRLSAGIVFSVAMVWAAMCMAVGNVSLLDWPMFTWSLGWTGSCEPSVPPTSWMHRLETTSFTFMFDWVPDPVCHTYSGNSLSSAPLITSSHTRWISSPFQAGSRPAQVFTIAAAFFTYP